MTEHETLMTAAKEAVQAWVDWCHENETAWTGWGDQIVPQAATDMRIDAEKVLATFPVAVTSGDRQ